MKKQLLSIIALILCFCTVFAMTSCSKEQEGDNSDSESFGESGETFDVEPGLEDVDDITAEDIFAQMKAAYKATLDYKGGYAFTINWVEDQTDAEVGKGGNTTNNKIVVKETLTADPSKGNAAVTLTTETYEDSKKTSSSTQESKIFNQNNKNYVYSSSKTDGIVEYQDYNTLTDYGFEAQKAEMLLSAFFGAESHFAESFGDPFSAASASDLKTVHTSVLNEVKENQKAIYEAAGYTVKTLNAKADIIFNKTADTNIFKRTVTVTSNLQNDGGTFQKNLTVESLLKTKNGKILSFVSTTTQSTSEKVGDTYDHQSDLTSSLSYDFSYALDNSAFNAIQTNAPAAGVVDALDYFEAPLTLVVGGNEIAITVMGEVSAENTVADVLENTINGLFADASIEYDGKWYTDAQCTKEFDISSVTTVAKLEAVSKLYNSGIKISSNCALFIDSGKETVNIPKNYTIVFGNSLSNKVLEAETVVREYDEENNMHRVSYEAGNGRNVTIKLNGTTLKYSENPEESDFQEESAGEFFHEFVFEGGKIYYISRANTVDKKHFTLDSFFVSF